MLSQIWESVFIDGHADMPLEPPLAIVYYALLPAGFFGRRAEPIYPEMCCFPRGEERICVYHI